MNPPTQLTAQPTKVEVPCSDLIAAAIALENWWSDQSESRKLPVDCIQFPLLDLLATKFALNDFETSLLLLLGIVEIDPSAGQRIHESLPPSSERSTHLSLAHFIALFPKQADPTVLLGGSPLREWELVHIQQSRIESIPLVHGSLRIDPRILSFLTNRSSIDPVLEPFLESELPEPILTPPQLERTHTLAQHLSEPAHFQDHTPLLLLGSESDTLLAAASEACRQTGLKLSIIRAETFPADSRERHTLLQLWHKEALLSNRALYLDATNLGTNRSQLSAMQDWVRRSQGALLIAAKEDPGFSNRATRLLIPDTQSNERIQMIQALLQLPEQHTAAVRSIADQFRLSGSHLYYCCQRVLQATPVDSLSGLVQECRIQSRPKSDHLMQPIHSSVGWDDLILPDEAIRTLRELTAQVRHRSKVYAEWGFADKSERGLNLTALLSGTSGTGKTLAAEVVANDLGLDLMRVDLSAVVSKYIGETEENLREVFNAAEKGGIVLLFDEADSLFGQRSKVNDSKDRNANIEVSYLLQRLESFGGLALLTTNLSENIDPAFLRRIRFHIDFPFPDRATRSRIWHSVFPKGAPLNGIDFERVGRLSLTGGHIRNIALNAAFLAAEEESPISNRHIAAAARSEFRKSEKPSPENQLRFLSQN